MGPHGWAADLQTVEQAYAMADMAKADVPADEERGADLRNVGPYGWAANLQTNERPYRSADGAKAELHANAAAYSSDAQNAIRRAGALGRLVAGRGSPRDLGQIRDGLSEARRIRDILESGIDLPPLLGQMIHALGGHAALVDHLARALVPSPPTERGQGGFIASGYDHSLDALRETSGNARKAIAALEAKYREETDTASLKVKHNKVLGYFIEVPAKHGDKLMAADSGFTHRQTMAGAVRFNSLGLHEEATRIAEAGAHALAAEDGHFEELVGEVVAAREAIAATAAALARIDVCSALAERAVEGDWARPEMLDEPCLEINGGRHPVVEQALVMTKAKSTAGNQLLYLPANVVNPAAPPS